MQDLPPYPPVDDAPDVFASGHLWVEELVVGEPLRFRLTDAGFLVFGDAERVFEHGSIPLRYRHAVRAVRESFARDAFREAVDDPESVTFGCVAVHRVDRTDAPAPAYDWARTPSVLGTDVHDATQDRFLPRDAVQSVFERVGLRAVDPIAKELRAADVDPASFPIPDSAWYDGPAAGVVFHNKRGGRAIRERRPDGASAEVGIGNDNGPSGDSIERLLDERVTDAWLDRVWTACEAAEDPTTVETLTERALERLARETFALSGPDAPTESEVRSALAARVDRYCRTRA
ncbi:hypothetical protein [Halorubrum vacuolatum]|uniref:RNA ligase domain-containing protein n=1 Tax=Halorubrum vacuolatum TaxID=63740 RepID=A0A238UQN1_HALVU|nr:hypothetical protein [Halorubrum vacuolatum]SNR23967.1 hypothetical protein SAMN06264855_101201 [Halorubrum vacuolatum]